jgi:hypothetical protein
LISAPHRVDLVIRITVIVAIGVSLRALPIMKRPPQLAASFIAASKSLCISPAFSQAFPGRIYEGDHPATEA